MGSKEIFNLTILSNSFYHNVSNIVLQKIIFILEEIMRDVLKYLTSNFQSKSRTIGH